MAAAAVVLLAVLAWLPAGAAAGVAAYAVLMLLPGAVLYALLERRPAPVEMIAAALVLSPIVTTALSALLMTAGASALFSARTVTLLVVATGVAAASGLGRSAAGRAAAANKRNGLSGRQWVILCSCVAVTLFLAGYLPLTREWWQFRSDAWFHRAVVAQVQDFGVPPEDPYFAGFRLQYMWFYHVLVLVLSQVTSLDPFCVMPLLNLHAVSGIYFATLLFAGVFVDRFSHRMWSCLTVVFGLNALFWLFLPVKAVRALIGDVRGVEELSRTFSMSPFDMFHVRRFVTIYFNDDLLFEKFMVATALVLAFAFMAFFWYASTAYLRTRRTFPLVAAGVSMVGMLGFHSVFGLAMMVAAGAGLGLSFVFPGRVEAYRKRPVLILAGVCALSVAATAPYLYEITSQKSGGHVFPLGLSLQKTVGVIITCAAVILLAAFQRRFFRARDLPHRYVQYATAAIAVLCVVLALPGANIMKLPLFLFYPLAVVGGWTIADFVSRLKSPGGRVGASIAAFVVVLAPVNAISLTGYFLTPSEPMYTADEQRVAAWVRANTRREAVFIDRDDEVFLLVAGPRRYYCGRRVYAQQWGYDPLQMAERFRARDDLLEPDDLDASTLRLLGQAPWPLYVIDRHGPGTPAVSRHPELFARVMSTPGIDVYRVDEAACAAAAR
jgi:hypothetical protein